MLECLSSDLKFIGYDVETGKLTSQKIKIPVLFGLNGTILKSFDVDGYHKDTGTVVEIEAGRAVSNYQFLKDLFESIVMMDINYLVIAVRNIYNKNKDFDTVNNFIEVLYTSQRIKLQLKGILVIGYWFRIISLYSSIIKLKYKNGKNQNRERIRNHS